ncbi:CCA tRNA nucleotidyltransferase [Acidianus sulfidivorans JP7]|uniref:CCA-adding enzyme n=1 Tax=Acidianus sulfidivorans JP7 TaxID=619593 RepID=A0A2U9IQL2_9CREN|nr:CCA tRNA nucleotidyltransferase [Acidianus sulfidivorans]AWR98312.1 CCA tRNA nucleotidyltransferase [Acidianus sulfidivorans JP7]
MDILNDVLNKIKPTEEDKEKIYKNIQPILDKLKDLDVQIHGSFRKGTWLKDDTDVDIFVFFPKSLGKEYVEKEAIKILLDRLKGFDITMAYAEHPYIIVNINGMEVDIVPALKINQGEEPITAVDRTPFHTEFINTHLTEKQKDDVRLLKRFMKGIGVYGAEIKVKGFSGYITELLIVYYGSFIETLKNASKWKPPVRLELVKPQKSFKCPLIIPDPIDPRRNAAAAVSLKRLAEFSIASRYFLRNPSLNFFFPKNPSNSKIKGDVLITVINIEEKAVEDLLWGQVYRSIDKIRNLLSINGYQIIDIQAYGDTNKVLIATQLESKNIGKYYLHKGPMFYMDIDNFIQKNENIWVGEDGILYSIKERKNENIEDIVKNAISIKYKYTIEQYWLDKEPEENCLKQFLIKTPPWLK